MIWEIRFAVKGYPRNWSNQKIVTQYKGVGVEVVIKDYAAFVVYQLNNSYRILKPIPENEKNFENIHPTTDRLYVRDIEMNAYIDALSKVIIILNEAYKDLRMAYITINTNAFF